MYVKQRDFCKVACPWQSQKTGGPSSTEAENVRAVPIHADLRRTHTAGLLNLEGLLSVADLAVMPVRFNARRHTPPTLPEASTHLVSGREAGWSFQVPAGLNFTKLRLHAFHP